MPPTRRPGPRPFLPARSGLTRLRVVQGLFLGVGLGVVVIVALHLGNYRARARTEERARATLAPAPRRSASPAAMAPGVGPGRGEPVSRMVDVELTRVLGSFRQFRVQAPHAIETAGETVASGGVRAQGEGRDGLSYAIAAETARGVDDWRHVVLAGDVAIRRSDGLAVQAEALEHFEKEQADVLRGGVRLADPTRTALAGRAEYKHATDELFLDGAVILHQRGAAGEPDLLLQAEHLYHGRTRNEVLLRDGVRLIAGTASVLADRLAVEIVDSRPRRAWFRGNDERDTLLELWSAGGCAGQEAGEELRLVRLRGLELEFSDDGRLESALPADRNHPLEVTGLRGGEPLWRLEAGTAEARFAPEGRPVELRVDKGLHYRANGPSGERRLDAPEGRFRTAPDGSVETAEFPRGLQLDEGGGRRLRGGRGRLDDAVLTLADGPRVELAGLRIEGREIRLRRDGSGLEARGQARGARTGPGEAVSFEAERMEFDPARGEAICRGKAVLRRGDAAVAADEIRTRERPEELEAQGAVRTGLGRAGESRIEAGADRMTWRGGEVTLDGAAHARGADLDLRADSIRFTLEAGGGAVRAIEARGGVEVEREGFRARAEQLVHDEAAGRTRLRGGATMVHVTARDGAETWGDEVVLWRDGGRLVVGSGEAGVARTRIEGLGPAKKR